MLQLSNAPVDRVNCHRNSIENLETAVLERVFFVKEGGEHVPPPLPREGHFGHALRHQYQLLVRCSEPVEPLTREEFLKEVDPGKKRVYQEALEVLRTRDLEKTDAHVSAFIKYEKEIHEWKKPVPRLISPRQYPFLLEDGRFYRCIEKRVMSACDSLYDAPTVMKGKNVKEVANCIVGAWQQMDDPVAIGVDASRFDQHVSREALMWQHSVQAQWFSGQDKKYYKRMQNMKLCNIGRGRAPNGGLKYEVSGTRTSGDADTGGGNCLLMCAMMDAFRRSVDLPQNKFRLVNNGDDCSIITERKYATVIQERIRPFFRELGFNMVVEQVVNEVEKISFCQMSPVETANGYVMVRNPLRALVKDCLSIRPIDRPSVYRKWMEAVADAGRSLTKGVPVYGPFYNSFTQCLPEVPHSRSRRVQRRRKRITLEESGLTRWGWDQSMTDATVTDDCRLSFYKAFGMTPREQLQVEDWFAKNPPIYGKPRPEAGVPGHSFCRMFD
jgi:hypothetical protein